MRAPFRHSPSWGWDEDASEIPYEMPYAAPMSVNVDMPEEVLEDEPELLGPDGKPVPYEPPPFGFCKGAP